MKRFWDPHNVYPHAQIKEFTYWVAEVSYAQHTLGSFIVFLKRETELLSDLTSEEICELPSVLKTIQYALDNNPLFKPDRYNYLQLGNSVHFLHIHGIPRYHKERTFNNRIWNDKSFGTLPTWEYNQEKTEDIIKIKDAISEYIR